MQIWQLLTLEIWMEQFIDSNPKNMAPCGLRASSHGGLWNGRLLCARDWGPWVTLANA